MLTLPKKPKVVERDGNRAVVEISELYPGYGSTVGNTIRRALYSSIDGAAITSFKIDGVPHEFSTMEGVLEDAIEISLNIKEVRLVLHGDEPQILKLKVKGGKDVREVTAKDIVAPSQVEVVNKDVHIMTITSPRTVIDMEFTVERGMGYVQTDKDAKEKKNIGVIRLDAVFTPVIKVNFEVENMRVGDRTDFDRLLLDITTDGTITPEDAYEKATEVLYDHFELLKDLDGKPATKKRKKNSLATKKKKGASSSKRSSGRIKQKKKK